MNILNNQKFLLAFKALVFVLITWFIVNQLFLKNDIHVQRLMFKENFKGANILFLLLAVLLMPANWLLETVKWSWLIRSNASFQILLRSVIAGITLGFITPARSGEFIGRTMFLDEEDSAKVFYLSVVGGIAHTAITLGAGAFFVAIWSNNILWSGIASGACVVFLLLYFRYDLFNNLISSIPFLERRKFILYNHQLPNLPTQINVLLITFMRYCVYILQYILLQMFFGVSDNFFALMVHNGVFFLIHSFSPLMPFLDFSFRGGAALYIFKDFSANNIGVLSAVTGAWILNLVVPALIGYLFILKKNS